MLRARIIGIRRNPGSSWRTRWGLVLPAVHPLLIYQLADDMEWYHWGVIVRRWWCVFLYEGEAEPSPFIGQRASGAKRVCWTEPSQVLFINTRRRVCLLEDKGGALFYQQYILLILSGSRRYWVISYGADVAYLYWDEAEPNRAKPSQCMTAFTGGRISGERYVVRYLLEVRGQVHETSIPNRYGAV